MCLGRRGPDERRVGAGAPLQALRLQLDHIGNLGQLPGQVEVEELPPAWPGQAAPDGTEVECRRDDELQSVRPGQAQRAPGGAGRGNLFRVRVKDQTSGS